MLNDLQSRILDAQNNRGEANRLVTEYLPLIKRQVSAAKSDAADYDDMLSIGMLAFLDAIYKYDPKRGAFIPYATLVIKNRLIDEYRKNSRAAGRVIPLFPDDSAEKTVRSADETVSIRAYQADQERQMLAEEIDQLNNDLERHGISFQELTRICPKRARSRKQCTDLAQAVVGDEKLRADFIRNSRLPQTALAERFKLSPKTIEKHRKYIVTIIVMMLGDYPAIRTFLPKEVDA
ncbi:MAG: sigma-70 family RNA polymerase sigma factor [Oscillospiraceae bacterium]|jgi:RNA polymerase sigma factor|nr:sigma-70 family RNA polymerase sigma factor [Oscillospiraceae bacterium]